MLLMKTKNVIHIFAYMHICEYIFYSIWIDSQIYYTMLKVALIFQTRQPNSSIINMPVCILPTIKLISVTRKPTNLIFQYLYCVSSGNFLSNIWTKIIRIYKSFYNSILSFSLNIRYDKTQQPVTYLGYTVNVT